MTSLQSISIDFLEKLVIPDADGYNREDRSRDTIDDSSSA